MGETLGFIGLGNIGGAVAANLVADGHTVVVFDTAEARVAEAVSKGARAVPSIEEVGRAASVTFLSLPTPAVVDQVADRWATAAPRDAVVVDLSTNAPASVRALGERLATTGHVLVEAPLTGGAPGAQARMLVFIVGGADDAVARVRPLLDRLGRAVFHLGPLGSGNVGKLVNSLMAFSATWFSLEGLTVAQKSGIDLRQMVDVVRTAGAGNIFIDRMVEGINQRHRPTQFALELAAKDAGLFVDVARECGVPVGASAQVAQQLVAAVGAGLGGRDFTDWVELIERLAGVQLTLAPPRG